MICQFTGSNNNVQRYQFLTMLFDVIKYGRNDFLEGRMHVLIMLLQCCAVLQRAATIVQSYSISQICGIRSKQITDSFPQDIL